ncbi:hypothetical protein KEF29_41120 [Streptomyces tuirus]|uniref:Uncharacterized protein n=1 Tax=Streptomyces tuirus TaxID=68278 RepID=A0A941J4A4_9ACTN|nr:hypothetical protein [Streptomyces tuirus]
MDDALRAHRVARRAVAAQHEPDLGDLVPPVAVDVHGTGVVPVGRVLAAALPRPPAVQ